MSELVKVQELLKYLNLNESASKLEDICSSAAIKKRGTRGQVPCPLSNYLIYFC